MSRPPLLYLPADAVCVALPMEDAVAAARQTFLAVSGGRVIIPPRTRLAANENTTVLLMSSLARDIGRLGMKLLTLFPGNPVKGIPFIQGLFVLADAETGTPLAVMDGQTITALRTGAASGAATDALSRADASVVAIFGAGQQAQTQLEAMCAVRPIKRAWVYDINPAAGANYAAEMAERLDIAVHSARTPALALKEADIVCLATTSETPVFDDSDICPGMHINAVGVYKPEYAEVPPETVRRARVVVDQRDAALAEAGDLLRPLRAGLFETGHFRTELGEVLNGSALGRLGIEDITLFKSVGLAAQDLFAAARAYDNARRLGLGIELPR
jgi:alanine dehydrogenase